MDMKYKSVALHVVKAIQIQPRISDSSLVWVKGKLRIWELAY